MTERPKRWPNPPVASRLVQGQVCYSVSDTAKMLGTSAAKVHQHVRTGDLEAVQYREGSSLIYVTGASINRFKYPDKS